MTVVFSTTFDGSENPLSEGGVWVSGAGAYNDVKKVSGLLVATTIDVSDCGARYSGIAIGANQYARATGCNMAGIGTEYIGVQTRMTSDTDADGYLLFYDGATFTLWRVDDTGSFAVTSLGTSAQTLTANFTIEIRSIGTEHYGYYNEALIITGSDGTYSSGQPGVGFAKNVLGNPTMSAFECGTCVSEYALMTSTSTPHFTTFGGTENPLSESAAWATPAGWAGALQKLTGYALGTSVADTSASYLAGTYRNNHYAMATVGLGLWAGVATRLGASGNCYLAIPYSSDTSIRLYRFAASGAVFTLLATTGTVSLTAPILIELISRGNVHTVYYTPTGGTRTLAHSTTDTTYPSGGAPGAVAYATSTYIYEWYGGNLPVSGGHLPLLHVG